VCLLSISPASLASDDRYRLIWDLFSLSLLFQPLVMPMPSLLMVLILQALLLCAWLMPFPLSLSRDHSLIMKLTPS